MGIHKVEILMEITKDYVNRTARKIDSIVNLYSMKTGEQRGVRKLIGDAVSLLSGDLPSTRKERLASNEAEALQAIRPLIFELSLQQIQYMNNVLNTAPGLYGETINRNLRDLLSSEIATRKTENRDIS